jgi:hypothetical protein
VSKRRTLAVPETWSVTDKRESCTDANKADHC